MKKRLWAFVMSVILIFTMFSVNVFAYENRTEKALEKIYGNGEVSFNATLYNFENDEEINCEYYVKDGKLALETDLPAEDELLLFSKIRVVMIEESLVLFFPLIPFFGIRIDDEDYLDDIQFLDMKNLSFVENCEKVIDGKTYYIEKFRDREGNIIEYTICDDEIKSVVTADSNGNMLTEINMSAISYHVDFWEFLTPPLVFDIEDEFVFF